MSYLQLLITGVIMYICVYSILDRICKCIETRAMSKSFIEFSKQFKDETDKSIDSKED